jgi:hypothetical protein
MASNRDPGVLGCATRIRALGVTDLAHAAGSTVRV